MREKSFWPWRRNLAGSFFNEADAAKWSAVATFFARDLAQRLADEGMDVTVGIIGCNWGGTSASAWTGRKMLEQDADTRSYVDEYDKTMEDKTFEGYLAELAEYEEWYNAWQPKINEYYATTPNPRGRVRRNMRVPTAGRSLSVLSLRSVPRDFTRQ